MYIAKSIEDKNEKLLGKVDNPFFIPVGLNELKWKADNFQHQLKSDFIRGEVVLITLK